MTISEPTPDKGRELVPAPWTVTEREKLILEGVPVQTFPGRVRELLRRAQSTTSGIVATTEGFKTTARLIESEASVYQAELAVQKAKNDLIDEMRRSEKLAGEEIEIERLRKENWRLQREAVKAGDEAAKQARLKEIAIAHGGTDASD